MFLRRHRKRTIAFSAAFAIVVDWSVSRAPRIAVNVVAEIRGRVEFDVSDWAGDVSEVDGGVVERSEGSPVEGTGESSVGGSSRVVKREGTGSSGAVASFAKPESNSLSGQCCREKGWHLIQSRPSSCFDIERVRTEKKCHMIRSSWGAKTSLTISSSIKLASSGRTYSTASHISTAGSQSARWWATRALSGAEDQIHQRSQSSRGHEEEH